MSLLLLFNTFDQELPPVVPIADEAPGFHVFLGWGNLIDQAIVSGGSWISTLPLTNLKNRTLRRVARSTDLSLASTRHDVDLGPNSRFRVLAFVNHNLSLDAKYRIRCGSDPTFADVDIDSGWLEVWPAVYATEDLDWDDANFWEGTYTEKERQGYTWTLTHKLPGSLSARYVRIEFDDPNNASDHVEYGRLFIGDGYTPSRNMTVGASLGWEDESPIDQAYGGAEYFGDLPRFRVARFSLQALPKDEAYARAFEIMRQMGRTGEVLIQWDPSDTKNAIRQSFVGRLRQLSPIEHPYPVDVSTSFEIQEARR